ncbi:hypothetical protein, partial [Chloroflexus aurantiacus]
PTALQPAFVQVYGWRGSMAAALQTRDTGNLVGKLHPRRYVMALAMVVSTPRCHTGRLGA